MKTENIIKFYKISAYLLLLGVVHCALTPVFYKTFFAVDTLWFFGAGLSLVFLCMLNIATSRLLDNWLLSFTFIGNIIGLIYSVILLFVLKKPQALVGTLFHLIVFVANYAALVRFKGNNQFA
jgi:hypothetical protein